MKARTFAFAVNVGKLIEELPVTTVNNAYGKQLVRSSSSIGANYRSATRGEIRSRFFK